MSILARDWRLDVEARGWSAIFKSASGLSRPGLAPSSVARRRVMDGTVHIVVVAE